MKILHVLGRIFLVLIITAIAVGVSCGGTVFIGSFFSKGGGYNFGPLILAAIVSAVVGIITFIWSIARYRHIIFLINKLWENIKK